jgi:hypothetical protein
MSFSAIPKWTLLDSDGAPVVGGKFKFYDAGTVTPKNVYSDQARSVVLGTEATTDSRGEVGPIFLDTAADTKVVAVDSADATLWTIDNLSSPGGSTGTLQGSSYSVSPLDYGGVGDGVTDDATPLQDAIDASTGDVDLAGKTYKINSQITLKSGLRLKNGVLDFSSCAATSLLYGAGSVASSILLTSSASPGDATIIIADTSTLAVGDWLLLNSNDNWATSIDDGEIVRVRSVDSSTNITLDQEIYGAYATGSAAKVAKITPIQRVAIDNVSMIAGNAASQSAIKFDYGYNCSIRDVAVSDIKLHGIDFRTSFQCIVSHYTSLDSTGAALHFAENCDSINASDILSVGGVGVAIGDSTYVSGGVSRNIRIDRGRFTRSPVRLDRGSHLCTASNLSVDGVSCYIRSQGSCNTIKDCVVDNGNIEFDGKRSLQYTLSSSNDHNGCTIEGNTVRNTGRIVVTDTSGALDVDKLAIRGNKVHTTEADPVRLTIANVNFIDVSIDSNDLYTEAAAPCVEIDVATTKTLTNLSVCNNIARSPNDDYVIDIDAVDAAGVSGANVSGNILVNDGTNFCVLAENTNNACFTDNRCTGGGISVTGSTASGANNVSIARNSITVTATHGIEAIGVSDLSVVGNVLSGGTDGLDSILVKSTNAAVANVVIGGNHCEGRIYAWSHTGGAMSSVAITGNVISAGGTTTAIGVSADSNDVTGFSITGNQINKSDGYGITVSAASTRTATIGTVAGNSIKCAATLYDCILTFGAGTVSDVLIQGNLTNGGQYGISNTVSGTADVSHVGNWLNGYNSASINGSFTFGAKSTTASAALSFSAT